MVTVLTRLQLFIMKWVSAALILIFNSDSYGLADLLICLCHCVCYKNGCSVRLLNPHTYSHNIWRALSMLQEYFGCVAGANMLVFCCHL